MKRSHFRSNLFAGALGLLIASTATADAPRDAASADSRLLRVDRSAIETRLERHDSATAQNGFTNESAEAILAGTDIAALEIALDASLPTVPSFDRDGRAFGIADGQLCVLMLEDFELRSRHSADSGGTFGTETSVAGGAGQANIKRYAARISADDRVYVALIVADAAGGLGLQFVRSDDMCQTWSSPATIVQNGDASHDLRAVAVATGASGVAAVIYRGGGGFDPYVIATTNFGNSWTSPLRVDAGATARTFASLGEAIAVDPATGNIYAAFSQDRVGTGASIWYTRSTNGGISFSAETSLDAVLTQKEDSLHPTLAVSNSGAVLLSLWDAAGTGRVYLTRSSDQGVTYGTIVDRIIGNGLPLPTKVTPASGSGTVLFYFVDPFGNVTVHRSADDGATFDAGQTLVGTAAGDQNGFRDLSLVATTQTAAGTWALAWSDRRSDFYTRLRTDVFVRTSTDDGLSWGVERRADTDTAGAQTSWMYDVAGAGADTVFVLFQDWRNQNGRSADFYANRSTATNPLSLGTDFRIDSDSTQISVDVNQDPVIATDGQSHIYAAFGAFGSGPEADLYVVASADGGYHFGAPVRVGGDAAGSRVDILPSLAATPDGRVYLVYLSDNASGQREIRFNRSSDFGATWQPTDMVLGSVAQEAGYFSFLDRPNVQIEAVSGGRVYIAWSSGTAIFLARSIDGGASFSTADVDQDTQNFNRAPRLCVQGSRVIIVWEGADDDFLFSTVRAVVSNDSGMTWDPGAELRPVAIGGGVSLPALACADDGTALAVWPDRRSGGLQLFANRYDGVTWLGDILLSTPSEPIFPVGSFSGTSNVVIAYEAGNGVYTNRSTDGGATFGSSVRQDSSLGDTVPASLQPRVAADGTGNLWISWLDRVDGLMNYYARHSTDGGANFGGPLRIDRRQPVGGSESFYFAVGSATPVTLPGAAFFTWTAERDSYLIDVLYNVHDLDDMDRDGFPVGVDCNDNDPSQPGVPAVVTTAVARITGGVRIAWSADPATSGDVASGLLSDLLSTGGYAAAGCLADNQTGAAYDDLGANPAPGDARWYLVRTQDSCVTGSFGDSSLPIDPRDDLDSSGATCD